VPTKKSQLQLQDNTWSYTRNQAQEIVTQAFSNNAYQWTGYANGTQSYAANGLNRHQASTGVGNTGGEHKENVTDGVLFAFTITTFVRYASCFVVAKEWNQLLQKIEVITIIKLMGRG
jgi:hypothetical protein